MANPRSFTLRGDAQLKLSSRDDIAPYLAQLEAVEELEEVHLGGNSLGVEACRALAEVLQRKKQLKVADFADIFTGRLIDEIPDALRALCDALLETESLVELDLSDNAFGGRSAEPMVQLLTHNHALQVLKLANNGLGITGGTIVANALTAAAKELQSQGRESNLRTVICGRNRLENGSAPAWAEAFAAHGRLREVRMYQNGIRMEGIEAITAALTKCPTLEVLDLMDNTATLRGSRAIAACLPSWPALHTLNLNDCLLRPRGGALVAQALAKGNNKALRKLQLGYCELDPAALTALAKAIDAHLENLESLDVNGNWAEEDDESIESIKKALEKWGHEEGLEELDDLDPEGELSDAEGEDAAVADEAEAEDDEDELAETTAATEQLSVADTQEPESAEQHSRGLDTAAAVVAAPAATAAVASEGVTRAIDNARHPADVEDEVAPPSRGADPAEAAALEEGDGDVRVPAATDEPAAAAQHAAAPEEPSAAAQAESDTRDVAAAPEAAGDSTSFEPITDASHAAPSVAEEATEAESAAPASAPESASEPAVPALVAVAEPAEQQGAETIEEAAEAAGPQVALDAAARGEAGEALPTEEEEEEPAAVQMTQHEVPASTTADSEPSAAPQETNPAVYLPVAAAADHEAATTASEVAESAREVPEESEAADVAEEVADSAREVPEQHEAAPVAHEAAQSADVPMEEAHAQTAADVADEVADSAREVPEEHEAAVVADEVAQSAADVPMEDVQAQTAADVADSAQALHAEDTQQDALASSDSAAQPIAVEPHTPQPAEPSAGETARSADAEPSAQPIVPASAAELAPTPSAPVAEQQSALPMPVSATSGAFGAGIGGANAVYAQLNPGGATAGSSISDVATTQNSSPAPQTPEPAAAAAPDVEALTQQMGKSSLAASHGRQESQDLSGELFSRAPASSSATPADEAAAPRARNPFRAAWGAVRELLR